MTPLGWLGHKTSTQTNMSWVILLVCFQWAIKASNDTKLPSLEHWGTGPGVDQFDQNGHPWNSSSRHLRFSSLIFLSSSEPCWYDEYLLDQHSLYKDNKSFLAFMALRSFIYIKYFIAHFTMEYSWLPLSRIPRDSLKHFEISVLRHIRVERVRKTINWTTHLTNEHIIWLLKLEIYI